VTIQNFVHKSLQRLYEDDNRKGVPPDALAKLRHMLSFPDDMDEARELRSLATWNAHKLTGDREGTCSLTVTRNWRLTFAVDRGERTIRDINLEDYH
jgi:proteic killer suppression protein